MECDGHFDSIDDKWEHGSQEDWGSILQDMIHRLTFTSTQLVYTTDLDELHASISKVHNFQCRRFSIQVHS